MKLLASIFEEKISHAMAEVSGIPDQPAVVKASQNERFGDFQANGIMGLAKKTKQNGRALAGQVVAALDLSDLCEAVEVAGPGFINLRLKGEFLAAQILEMTGHDQLGIDRVAAPETVVVDFSCPNIAKEMHVGHIRSTIIGDAVSRLLEVLGHDVRRINHIGDWGTQFGMLIQYLRRAYPDSVTGAAPLAIEDLEDFYRKAKACFDEEPEFADASRKEVTRLQGGEPESRKAWETICQVSREKFQEIYELLDIQLTEMGESFYNPFLPDLVTDLLSRSVACESEGAICIFVAGMDAPFMIQKRDGGFGYATTDMAALRYRIRELGAVRIIYVTDARQKDHFKQLFAAAGMAGYTDGGIALAHAAFGSILGKDGKPLKTRASRNVLLKEIIEEAITRARRVVQDKNPDLPEEAVTPIAEAVGLGALKYMDLRQNPASDYVFDWDRMLSLEGDTAPYLQYAYARICAIFRKGDIDPSACRGTAPVLAHEAERRLALFLLRYNETVIQAARDIRPNQVANYLYELATRFTGFYTACPVLKAEAAETKDSRLLLCDLTGRVMKHGLGLLGINVSERM